MAVIEERKSKDGISYRVKIRLKGYKPEEATFKEKQMLRIGQAALRLLCEKAAILNALNLKSVL